MTGALVPIGAPGSGKSSVLEALTTRLEIDGVPYGALEAEQLAWRSPWLTPAQWLPQLAAVMDLQRQAGRRLFLVAATVETAAELLDVIAPLAVERVLVVCLTASPDTVAARVAEREPDAWPGKAALVAHARRLAGSIPAIDGIDQAIATEGREAVEVAVEVRTALRGLLEGGG